MVGIAAQDFLPHEELTRKFLRDMIRMRVDISGVLSVTGSSGVIW